MQELGLSKITIPSKSPIERAESILAERKARLEKVFATAVVDKRIHKIRRYCRELSEVHEFMECLEKIPRESSPGTNPRRTNRSYAVSSMFLHQCFKYLTADKDEQFVFITGPEMDGVLVLDQKIEFQHQKRNLVSVVGDAGATHRLLIKLEQFGHRLLAHFHSHPGNGLNSTFPSGTDEKYQQRLESAGYPTVAAIFSRDGYFRFFRLDKNLEITIHGKGVNDLGNHTYKLTELD